MDGHFCTHSTVINDNYPIISLTAAASNVQRSLFCIFFLVMFMDLESILTGTGALGDRYSSQISWTFALTSFCGRHLSSCTAVRNLQQRYNCYKKHQLRCINNNVDIHEICRKWWDLQYKYKRYFKYYNTIYCSLKWQITFYNLILSQVIFMATFLCQTGPIIATELLYILKIP